MAADLPLASEPFDWNVRVRGSRENRRFQLVHDEWTRWSAAHPAGQAEEFIHWAVSLPSPRRERVVWYISRRLSDPFLCRILGRSATFTIDDSRVRQLPGVLRAQRFLQRFLGADVAGIVPARALGGLPVTRVLDRLALDRGLPHVLRTDNALEFCGRAMLTWAHERRVTLRLIEPGKPNQNAYIESFNGRFRDECLNEHGSPVWPTRRSSSRRGGVSTTRSGRRKDLVG